jgi:diguanylate cyclase
MNTAAGAKKIGRPTLLNVLRRAHLNITFVMVTIVGVSLTTTGAIILLTFANGTLSLVARAISHNVEAAVVFDDRIAAYQALVSIASTEDVAEASIVDARGNSLARWQSPERGTFAVLRKATVTFLHEHPVMVPITHDGIVIGEVTVTGNGRDLLHFMLDGILSITISQALILIGSVYWSRRMLDDIVGPLQTFADVAHAVRSQRDFEQRVPEVRIAELNSFGENFNALLDELASRQVHVETEKAVLEHRASHDSLTGLANRAVLEERLNKVIADADKQSIRAAVLYIDCDRFKEINDRYGHAAGDVVLVSVAKRIKEQVREADLVVRLGGDEFALLMTPIRDAGDAFWIADVLEKSMRRPITLPTGEAILTSLSIGVALYPEEATDADSLLHKADQAMYRVKFANRANGTNATLGTRRDNGL